MSDMPDFDSMTPEEMMRWMESLAKRQGASEGLTTEADAEIEEVSADDERLAGQGDYIPYGWSEEKWREQQAKEAAAKAAQQSAAPEPEPEPEPEPVAAAPEPDPVQPAAEAPAPADDEMPDFDSMSPEEMMRWMESLAKRQGASEGLTTDADLEIGEVSADDERLSGQGDYIPYGWSEEKWREQQAKESAAKAAQQSAEAEPEPEPVADVAPELADLIPEAEDVGDYEDYEEYDEYDGYDEDDDEVAAPADMSWLQDMAGGDIPEPASTPAEPAAEAPAESAADPMEWLADLSGQDEPAPPEPEPADAAADPMAWLADLSEDEPAESLDFDMSALGDLAALGENDSAPSSDNPMDWLAGLAADDQPAAEAEPAAEPADEGSLEWMESLAKRQGADSQELITDADLELPEFEESAPGGPGYEAFSFESGTGLVADEDSDDFQLPANLDTADDIDDPESWLDQLASGIGTGDTAPAETVDDLEEDGEFVDFSTDINSKLSTGTASEEDIEQFFSAAFERAEQRGDVPDYIEEDSDDGEDEVVEAEIPDWLRESMASAPAEDDEDDVPAKRATAEMMIADLGLEDDLPEPADIPDWLQSGAAEETGAIEEDIFDDLEVDEATAIAASSSAIPDDTGDSWVEAFTQEASGELSEWYDNAVANIQETGEQPSAAAPEAEQSLQAADLPTERNLPAGQPQAVPDWMSGEAQTGGKADSMEMAGVGAMDWLNDSATDSEGMPDWLQETVVEEEGEALPEWLATEDLDLAGIDDNEIPDWLRETMEEEEDPILVDEPPAQAPAPVEAQPPAPAPQTTAPVPVQQSPAPVPQAASSLDVAATLQSAQEKVSAGDVDSALLDYELVVRANVALDQVENALQKLAGTEAYKRNPAVNRVLGDVMMRQGKLQQALDIYRKALNML